VAESRGEARPHALQSRTMADWKLANRKALCNSCEREFSEGEALYSLLVIEDGELQRHERCDACWDEAPVDAGVDTLPIWWRTNHQEGRRGPRLDLDSIQSLFLGLDQPGTEELSELRYLLSLILMRKRRLKMVKVVRGERGEGFIVRRPRRKEELFVAVYDLNAERTAQLRETLVGLFDGADAGQLLSSSEGGLQEPADQVAGEGLTEAPLDGAHAAPGAGPRAPDPHT